MEERDRDRWDNDVLQMMCEAVDEGNDPLDVLRMVLALGYSPMDVARVALKFEALLLHVNRMKEQSNPTDDQIESFVSAVEDYVHGQAPS